MDDSSPTPDPLDPHRRDFRAYYSIATIEDAAKMDLLIYAYSALTFAIRHPRDPQDPDAAQLEKDTDVIEKGFVATREALRTSPTFRNLCESDRRRIENTLFSPYPPWE